MKHFLNILLLFFCGNLHAQNINTTSLSNSIYTISWQGANCKGFDYSLKSNNKLYNLTFPSFEIEGEKLPTILKNVKVTDNKIVLKNGVSQYKIEGNFVNKPELTLSIAFEIAPDNAVVRFQYSLKTKKGLKLTKKLGNDNISYFSFINQNKQIKEIRVSEFNERFHATHRTEYVLDERYFKNDYSFMGPMAVCTDDKNSFIAAYEHGSQYPDRFLEFQLKENKTVTLAAVKGNYLPNQLANGFSSVWLEFGAVNGDEDKLANEYRNFVLHYLTQNSESRKPYIFYNTWGRQERVHWGGKPYLASMNLDWTLKEIDRAHAMGIEVYVIDAGWFEKTGDWQVNKDFFSDELKKVKAKLDGYGMKLGLWFNPTVAAVTSDMYRRNMTNRMSVDGVFNEPVEIWETEKSVGMCLVSPYWEDFANKLITLTKELGVTYFKWDAVGQYGCNNPNHYHGNSENTPTERAQRYSFLQPEYMVKIVNKVCKEAPQSIFDFDISEDGRCVGLQYLSAGKYFIINNGPYYHNFDLAGVWKSVLPNQNPNIFVEPGPARGWFVRSVLDYDKWIPSVLFLTHYQPDEPRNSQIINLASLIFGQNGVWGEILKTSESGVKLFDDVLTKYKVVRDDITAAQMIKSGEPGGSPEVYEKINPATGKGCVVIFANAKGKYTYITSKEASKTFWHTEGVQIKYDADGKVIITADFTESSAKIILFGIN